MTTLEALMPHDLQVANKYIDKTRTLRSVLAESGSQPLLSLVDSLSRATVQFGRCELHMHIVDRNAALKTNLAVASAENQRAMQYHRRGLDELEAVKSELTQFAKVVNSENDTDFRQLWKRNEAVIRQSWTEALADLDIKPTDAEKLNRAMTECCEATTTGGLRGLGEHIAHQFSELERLRKTPSRGTEDNWPYWKLVAVAAWLGMTVASVILALQRGAHWWDFAMIALISLIGVLLIGLGC